MTNLPRIAALSAALVLAATAVARAENAQPDHDLTAADDTIEITVGAGYNHVAGDTAMDDGIAGVGGNVELQVGYRVTPELTLGTYAAVFHTGEGGVGELKTFGAAAGVESDWHFRPHRSIDPWVSAGFGWRGTWISQTGEDTGLQGFDVLRFQIGLDQRFSRTFALAPYLGVTATTFVAEDSARTGGYDAIDQLDVDWTFNAGVQARFDPNPRVR